jgi:hypothetical protein
VEEPENTKPGNAIDDPLLALAVDEPEDVQKYWTV